MDSFMNACPNGHKDVVKPLQKAIFSNFEWPRVWIFYQCFKGPSGRCSLRSLWIQKERFERKKMIILIAWKTTSEMTITTSSVKLIVNKSQNVIHHFEWRSSRWILVAVLVYTSGIFMPQWLPSQFSCLALYARASLRSHDYLTIRQPCVQWLVAGKQ